MTLHLRLEPCVKLKGICLYALFVMNGRILPYVYGILRKVKHRK